MDPSLDLQVSLTSSPSTMQAQSPSTFPVTVTVHNPASSPVTVLKWGTPLDNRAGLMGIFEVCDTSTGHTLTLDTIKISRKLPPSREDLIEISPKGTLERTVDLPRQRFRKGHEYSIRAQGLWHAIWKEPVANVTASQLQDLTGAARGGFSSEVAIVKVD
ncbi:uncharacterized protein N7459_004589 [Penicillium hispanicum]|uniref:uncharacterized protein n=1 Tax=Penicillium hispanicum TaxID=1080232 RepID=UPI002540EB6D|nr:uncharacterized protein N7459_004589 [Penicillium hispanicum]KAJ5584789.1 hypothetical protein N7459_004589 [Penicillium hispanicum]